VVETLSLDPSDTPVTIKMSPGLVTTFTVLDATGAPWPIQDISWAGKFQVTPPEEGGHIVRITPETAHGVGNISMRLVDLVTPIAITLRTGLDEVHYRFDARVPKPGPLARPSIIEYGGLKALAGQDGDMEGILDGTPPMGAVKLKIDGGDLRTTAWRSEGTGVVYLRTPLTLLSPGWDSSMSSSDGMNVYSMGKTPVILLSDRGRMVRVRLSEDDEVTP
jgi:intracellular multiplication protein IcmK